MNDVPGATRLLRLGYLLWSGKVLTARFIREHYGVSESRSKEDMRVLEAVLPVEVELKNRGKYVRGEKHLRIAR